MTRMQKWETYRQEIDQSSYVGKMIEVQSKKIEQYKREIDKINPAILQNVGNVNLNLHKGVSEVIVSQKQIPNQIKKMFIDLNKGKTENNQNNISTILMNLENNKILDANKKIKENWLNNDENYNQLSNFIQKANFSLSQGKEFEKDLNLKFQKLSTKKIELQIGTIQPLAKNATKNIGHHVFAISIAIAIVFFLLIIVLIFVRWFAF